MATKICTVKGIDPRGLPKTTTIEAGSLFEAAAAGLEKLYLDGGCQYETREVTVHEPRESFQVRAGQLVQWLGRRGAEETIGTTALKRRVQELLRKPIERTTGRREERRR